MAPSDTIELVDKPEGRFYRVGEEEYPSVTTILSVLNKPALNRWAVDQERELVVQAACELYDQTKETLPLSPINYRLVLRQRLPALRAAERTSRKAAQLGTAVHAFIERELKQELGQDVGSIPFLPDGAQTAIDAWHEWRESVKFEPMAVEEHLFNEVQGYAGTADWIAIVDGEWTLGDIKTGKKVWPEAFLQNWAYRMAWNGFGRLNHVTAGVILRLPKTAHDPTFEAALVPDEEGLYDCFLSAKCLFDFQNNGHKAEPRQGGTLA